MYSIPVTQTSQKQILASRCFNSAIGQTIFQCETQIAERLVPRIHYQRCVQVEGPSHLHYFDSFTSVSKYRVSQELNRRLEYSIVGVGECLPFGAESIDYLFLPHVLDFCDRPEELLQETTQCMTVDGVLLITGFNPRSMLALLKRFKRIESLVPSTVKFYSVHQIRQWLSLLGFEIFAAEFGFFRPPFRQHYRLKRLEKWEIAGARWWPTLGSVYVLAARRQNMASRIKPQFLNLKLKHRKFRFEH